MTRQASLPYPERAAFSAVPCSRYSFEALADIYNQTRVDYLVPMPMNAKRLEEYALHYDVDLDASSVAVDSDGEIGGIGMLGVRGDHTWITRLGVIPSERRRGTGQFLMSQLIGASRQRGARLIQLEVIKGNTPAEQLFIKNHFQEIRELLVIRRPPAAPEDRAEWAAASARPLSPQAIHDFLAETTAHATWIEDQRSLENAGGLKGLYVELPDGTGGRIVYRHTVFQLTHVHLEWTAREVPLLAEAMLYHLHQQNRVQDTKIENLPVHDPCWQAFQKLGYVEVFRRTEMYRYLAQ